MHSRRAWRRGLQGVCAVAVACVAQSFAITPHAGARDMTATRLLNADAEPDNWLHHHQNYAGHRFGNLTQITAANVRTLKLSAMILLAGQTPAEGGRQRTTRLEGTPIAEDGFVYVTDGWGALYKIDLRSGRRADFVWKMDPRIDKVWAGDVACCGVNNRGAALWKDQVVSIALDGRMFAVNKESGQVTWERTVADPSIAETLTAAPLVVGDLAIVGPAGAEFGIRGWLEATDLNTGNAAWRTYTIPAKGEPGNETWADPYNAWETGGASIWVTGTYDPVAKLMYWGTGNPAPQIDAEYRPGDNLFTDSLLALDPATGKIKWYFQYTPNDPFDYDEVAEHTLIDIDVGGQMRGLVTHVARNGFFYGFDRVSGEFVYAKQYPNLVTWTDGIDPKSGKPLAYNPRTALQQYNPGSVPRRGVVGVFCPALPGGKNWEPSTYSRTLRTVFTPSTEGCSAFVAQNEGHFEGKLGGTFKKRTMWDGRAAAPATTQRPLAQTGYSINALDPRSGQLKTKVMQETKTWGLVATAGGVVFGGNQLGDFSAFDARTLSTLWTFNVGTPIQAPPMTFAVNGHQYVAIMAGGTAGPAQRMIRSSTQFFTPSNYVFFFSL
ncbi:MAG: PQQ-dependent dehydrogenase, methanol/ethanol family [Alphaproteobacteria bacterium]|nr:PQQ-dependent dehydrogenase, methanol/ethanol family [Alphaproteobacteria bacterium]